MTNKAENAVFPKSYMHQPNISFLRVIFFPFLWIYMLLFYWFINISKIGLGLEDIISYRATLGFGEELLLYWF